MAPASRHVRSQWIVLGAIVLCAGWLGCASETGDAGADEPELKKAAPAASSTNPADPPGGRPAFEAGAPEPTDDPKEDPTPVGGGDTCADKTDPGSSENTAKVLAPTTDAQNVAIEQSGVLNGPVDVDFYKLAVADTNFHLLEPATEIKTSGVEMCVFVKCPTGKTASVTCTNGGVAKKSDIGTDGCCATGPSAATPTWNCSGLDDSATLFFRVKQTQNKCTPYSFSYSF